MISTVKGNSGTSKYMEKTRFEEFEEDLKLTIFGVLFVLVEDGGDSLIFTIIMMMIDFFQLLGFPFHISVRMLPFANSF
jgi:hypothetical protein